MKVFCASLIAFFFMVRVVLGGITIEWTGGGGNANWTTPGNWNPAQVPVTNDTAVFLSGSNNVTLNIDITNNVVLNAGALLVARVPDKTTKTLIGSLSGDGRLVVTGNTGNGSDAEILKVSHRNVTHTGGTELQNGGEINFYPGQLDSWFGTTNIVLRRGIFKVEGISVPAADTSLYPQNASAPYIICRNTVVVEEEGGSYGMLNGSGANDYGRFFGPVILGGRLSVLSGTGGNMAGVNLAGGILLLQDKVRDTAISFDTGHNGNDFISAPITDDTGSAGNPLRLRTTNRAVVLGTGNSTYASGTLVEAGANTITVSASAKLGTGPVTVSTGGVLIVKCLLPAGTACSLAAAATAKALEGGVLASGLASASKNTVCTNGSTIATFTGLNGTADLFPGQAVSGTGIPAGTIVQSVDGFQRITLSQAATSTGTPSLTFAGVVTNSANRFTADSVGLYGIAGATHAYDMALASLGNGSMILGSPSGIFSYQGLLTPSAVTATAALGGGSTILPQTPDPTSVSTASLLLSPPWANALRCTQENMLQGTNHLDIGVKAGVGAIYGTAILMTNNAYTGVTRVCKGAGLAIGYKGGTPLGNSLQIVVEKGGYFGPAALGSLVDSRINAHYTNVLFQAGSYLTFFCAIDSQNGQLAFNYDAFSDTETVRLDDTSFMLAMNTSLKPIETMGALSVKAQGRWVRGYCGGTPASDYTSAALVRDDPFAVFDGCNTDGAKAKLKFSDTTAVALTNGMCTPWIQADAGLSTYDLNGLRPVTNGFVAFASAGVSDIARITANTDVTADKSVYALRVDGVDVTGSGKTISILSGGFHTFAGGKKSWVNYAFPNTLAYCMMANASDNTGNFIAPHGLIKTGKGDLRLYGSGNVISNILAVYGANVVLKSSQAASEVAYLTNCVVRLGAYGGLNVNGANGVAVKGLEGSGTVSGATTAKPVTILRTLKPGSETAPGTLTASAGKLVLGSECTSRFRLGYLSDKVVVNGDMTVAGTVNIEAAAGVKPGRYALATAIGGTMDGTVVRGSAPDGYAMRLTVEGNTLYCDLLPNNARTMITFF